MSTNCLQFLSTYANFLNANASNADITGYRPHPIFFSGYDCSGDVWPTLSDEPPLGQTINNPTDVSGHVGTAFGSFFVPTGWTVTLTDTQGATGQYGNSGLPLLVTQSDNTLINNVSITNNIVSASLTAPTGTATPNDWKLQMCMNQITTLVGAQRIVSWQPASLECDAFMTSYCASVAGQTCAPNSTEIGVVAPQYLPCVCLIENNCIRDSFCEPGNTNPACQGTAQSFALFIPVQCFGKQCSESGYRWNYMSQQCNLTLCQQIISLIGNDVTVTGSSTLYCGQETVPLTSVTTTPVPLTSAVVQEPISSLLWLVIAVVGFVLAVTVPLAIIVYYRRGSGFASWRPQRTKRERTGVVVARPIEVPIEPSVDLNLPVF